MVLFLLNMKFKWLSTKFPHGLLCWPILCVWPVLGAVGLCARPARPRVMSNKALGCDWRKNKNKSRPWSSSALFLILYLLGFFRALGLLSVSGWTAVIWSSLWSREPPAEVWPWNLSSPFKVVFCLLSSFDLWIYSLCGLYNSPCSISRSYSLLKYSWHTILLFHAYDLVIQLLYA